jgi:hypothetical protein
MESAAVIEHSAMKEIIHVFVNLDGVEQIVLLWIVVLANKPARIKVNAVKYQVFRCVHAMRDLSYQIVQERQVIAAIYSPYYQKQLVLIIILFMVASFPDVPTVVKGNQYSPWDDYGNNHPLFNQSTIYQVYIEMSEEDVAWLHDPANKDEREYKPITTLFIYNGIVQETLSEAGKRIRGDLIF